MNLPATILGLLLLPALIPIASAEGPTCDVNTVAYYPQEVSPTSRATVKTIYQMSDARCIVESWGIGVASSDGTRSGGDVEVYDTFIVVTLVADALPVGYHSVTAGVSVVSPDGTSGDQATFNFGFRTYADL